MDKEGAEIIVDNCQVSIFGGFAPDSQTAQELSRSLGSQTILSGSVSKGRDRSDAEGRCWPEIKRIAAALRLSRSTVKRSLADLERAGFLARQERRREIRYAKRA